MPNKDLKLNFQGFSNPTTTPVPDDVFDSLMYFLTDPELRVLLYIIRRTYGFKKSSDNISLKQLVEGIKKKDGSVLDLGTGISKPTVTKAVKGLVEKGVIIAERNRSKERGDEPTTYKLRFKEGGGEPVRPAKSPPSPETPVLKDLTRGGKGPLHGGVKRGLHGGVNGLNTQQTVVQETEDNNDVVVEQLKTFGISGKSAEGLSKNYPEEYITDKLSLAQWLVDQGSPLVRKNPAGWLKTAIEEDYQAPQNYETPSRRKARTESQAKAAAAAAEKRQQAEQEFKLAQEKIQRSIRENHPPEPVGKDGLTTESAWALTLEQMETQLSTSMFQTWLKNTMLVSVEGTTANVVVPSQLTADWIERRLYQSLQRTLTNIVGHDIEFRFIPAAIPQLAAS